MEQIADCAASRGNLKISMHILLVLERLCSQADAGRAKSSFERALQCINPALSHTVQPTQLQAQREETLALADALRQRLSKRRVELPPGDVDAFQDLCTIARFHVLAAAGDSDKAIQCFFTLSFVPLSPAQVDQKAQIFNADVSDDVVTAMPHTVLVAFQQLHAMYTSTSSGEARLQLQRFAQALRQWQAKWRFHTERELAQNIARYDSLLSLP